MGPKQRGFAFLAPAGSLTLQRARVRGITGVGIVYVQYSSVLISIQLALIFTSSVYYPTVLSSRTEWSKYKERTAEVPHRVRKNWNLGIKLTMVQTITVFFLRVIFYLTFSILHTNSRTETKMLPLRCCQKRGWLTPREKMLVRNRMTPRIWYKLSTCRSEFEWDGL